MIHLCAGCANCSYFLKRKKEKKKNNTGQILKEVLAPLRSVHLPSPNSLIPVPPQPQGLRRYTDSVTLTQTHTYTLAQGPKSFLTVS